MAKSKRSTPAQEPKVPLAPSRKYRRSAPQSQTTHKSSTLIHYEIDTEYGRLVCDYDVSSALATDEQGDDIAAIIKYLTDRFNNDLVTSPKHPEFSSGVKKLAKNEGLTYEQAEQELRKRHRVSLSLHLSDAWSEFVHGLQIAIKNAMSQQFEMSIIVAKIQHGELAPKLSVADGIIELVKQQIEQRIKSPHIGGGPLLYLAWHYYVCLRDWQEAKRIYRRKRNSTSWRKLIKDEYPDLPDDLIEWLAFSENKSDLEADAFQNLPDDARRRLNNRIEKKGYGLSMPSEIALEHAARVCGSPPYSYSIFRLKNIKSEHAEEAERAGVRYYLKNPQSRRSHLRDTTED